MFSANFSIDDNATAPDSSGEGMPFPQGGGPPMMIMDMNKYSSEIVAERVFVLVFGSLGLFGNTVSFLVSSKLSEKGKDSSGTVLMKCLAVADNLSVCRLVLDLGFPLFGPSVRTLSQRTCQLMAFLSGVGTLSSNYILIALSIDRVFALYSPVKYYQNSKPHHALLAFVGMVLVSGVVKAYFGIVRGICSSIQDKPFSKPHSMLGMLLTTLVPIVAIISCSFGQIFGQKYGDKWVAFRMFSLVEVEKPFLKMMVTVKELPLLLNNSVNFFLYMLASKSFRTAVFSLFVMNLKNPQKNNNSRSNKKGSECNAPKSTDTNINNKVNMNNPEMELNLT